MKVLVLGKGYLGSEFERMGYEVWGRDKFEIPYTVNEDDIDIDPLPGKVMEDDIDVIVNCISKCDTRWNEKSKNFDEAMFVNARIPKILSEFCEDYGIKFVQISTGCLYDDTSKPNKETDFLSAHCKYTLTKWAGEIGLNPERDLILRPRLLFNDQKTNKNLLYRMKTQFDRFVSDELDSVTCTKTIVEATQALLDSEQVGIFNVAEQGEYSMFDIASRLHLATHDDQISIKEIRGSDGLYLVNNTMDLTKLKEFYEPKDALKTFISCYNKLNETSSL